MSEPIAIYGTMYLRPEQIEPRCVVREGGEGVVVTLDSPGCYMSPAIVGSADEVIALLTRAATAVADATEPEPQVFEDIPPHPRVDVIGHRFAPSYADDMDAAGDHQHRDVEDQR